MLNSFFFVSPLCSRLLFRLFLSPLLCSFFVLPILFRHWLFSSFFTFPFLSYTLIIFIIIPLVFTFFSPFFVRSVCSSFVSAFVFPLFSVGLTVPTSALLTVRMQPRIRRAFAIYERHSHGRGSQFVIRERRRVRGKRQHELRRLHCSSKQPSCHRTTVSTPLVKRSKSLIRVLNEQIANFFAHNNK